MYTNASLKLLLVRIENVKTDWMLGSGVKQADETWACAILFISIDVTEARRGQTKSVALVMGQLPLWPICLNLDVIGHCNTRRSSHSIQKLTSCMYSTARCVIILILIVL